MPPHRVAATNLTVMEPSRPAALLFAAAIVAVVLALVACSDTGPTPADQRAYVHSGQCEQDVRRVAGGAEAWLDRRVARSGSGLTAVFDVDETLFSNLPLLEEAGFDSRKAHWAEWEVEANAPPIQPVVDLLAAAKAAGVRVVLVIGRRER